jgi:hypothetical protein
MPGNEIQLMHVLFGRISRKSRPKFGAYGRAAGSSNKALTGPIPKFTITPLDGARHALRHWSCNWQSDGSASTMVQR